MAKKTIKLSEAQLRNMIAESIEKVLKEEVMTPEEEAFRKQLSPNFNQAKLVYLGKISNGNTLIKYSGVTFQVTPKGKMIRV